MTRSRYCPDKPPFVCHFCTREIYSKYSQEGRDWDWFTGTLKETVYICPKCRNEYRHEVTVLMHTAGVGR